MITDENTQHIAWTRNRTERLLLAVVNPYRLGYFTSGAFARLVRNESEASLTILLDVMLMKTFGVAVSDARNAFDFATSKHKLKCSVGKGESAAGFILPNDDIFGENLPNWRATPWHAGFRCEFSHRLVANASDGEWQKMCAVLEEVFETFSKTQVQK